MEVEVKLVSDCLWLPLLMREQDDKQIVEQLNHRSLLQDHGSEEGNVTSRQVSDFFHQSQRSLQQIDDWKNLFEESGRSNNVKDLAVVVFEIEWLFALFDMLDSQGERECADLSLVCVVSVKANELKQKTDLCDQHPLVCLSGLLRIDLQVENEVGWIEFVAGEKLVDEDLWVRVAT